MHPQLAQLAYNVMKKRVYELASREDLRAFLGTKNTAYCEQDSHPSNIGRLGAKASIMLLELVARLEQTTWYVMRILLDSLYRLRFYRMEVTEDSNERWWRPYLPKCIEKGWLLDPGSWIPHELARMEEIKPAHCNMPSWIEVHRVHRAVWRLELFREHLDSPPEAAAPPDDTSFNEELELSGAPNFWSQLPKWELDELQSVNVAQNRLKRERKAAHSRSQRLSNWNLRLVPAGLFAATQPPLKVVPHEYEVDLRFEAGRNVEEATRWWGSIVLHRNLSGALWQRVILLFSPQWG